MPDVVIHATVNVTIQGNASEGDVREGVRRGLTDLLTDDKLLKKIREGRQAGGF